MSIREAGPADVEAIGDVAAASWHAAYDDALGSEAVDRQLARWYAPEAVERRLAATDHHLLVAEAGARVVGFAHGAPSPDGPADAQLVALYVEPERWGEGVGSRLLEALTGRLREDGHHDLWLEVLAENDVGRSFYRSHGFEVLDRYDEVLAGVSVVVEHRRRSL
ncbi:MAG: N-acetyltransferase family protein [Halobacteriales archaeon]